MRCAVCFS